ncbi:MAG: asparagine synthase-related protein [Actinomycetota bacterium]|nr:asparagine synthase-related protein [Actinomycetota bacterium]
MTGIFGVLDAQGVDVRRVSAAAGAASFRGEPVVWCEGPFALGHYRQEAGWSSLAVNPETVVAIDGRIDATLAGTPSSLLGGEFRGHALLAAVLTRHGGAGLSGLAADFAVARLDRQRGVLLLSRDAFALRPLFWAKRGRSMAFASDPEVLISLGFATGALDRERVSSYLAGWEFDGERSAFEGVLRVEGGTCLEADLEGRINTARWFHPEEVAEQPCTLTEAAGALREVLDAAVVDRTNGRRAALLLSGGRDSGSVALAGARSGAELTCLTKQYPPGLGCSEEAEAEELARSVGYDCRRVVMPSAPTEAQLITEPHLSGTPLALASFNEHAALRAGVAASDAEVVVDGDGGDTLFEAGPIAALDLVRRWRFRQGAAVLRFFPRAGRYSSVAVAKRVGRAVCPAWLVGTRDRYRRPPPWVVFPVRHPVSKEARNSRRELTDELVAYSLDPTQELAERLMTLAGARRTSPLLDQRVVQLALSWPVDLRASLLRPKPVLGALLGPLDESRRKANFLPYYLAMAEASRRSFATWYGPDSQCARQGYVDGRSQVSDRSHDHSSLGLLQCLALEAWLRRTG